MVVKTAAENQNGLRLIVQQATEWESKSGASSEGAKTVFIHFTRNSDQSTSKPITVNGQEVRPTPSVKILGQVIGCFRTVGTAVEEAEANLHTISEPYMRTALGMWIDLHSMPGVHPIAQFTTRPAYRRFVSPI